MLDKELGERLIKARSGHGWSQADLSEVSGVAAAQISRYEAGKANPRTEVVAKLARALAVSFDWLRTGEGVPEAEAEVPKYPASQSKVLSVELDEETRDGLTAIAGRNGMTTEMALKHIVRLTLQANGDPATLENLLRHFREGK